MKVLLLVLMVCSHMIVFCNILEVDISGNHEYTSIQEAINNSVNCDTILVYHGRYYENINLNGHNIILASLYLQDPIQSHIDSTIIDGNYLGSCIMIDNGETAEVNGFTLINNEEGINIPLDDLPNNAGGGICIAEGSQVSISNCIIRNCFSRWGGGIAIRSNSYSNISNVIIRNNRALINGGGLYVVGIVDFDQSNLCSIYNNIAPMGMDMYFYEYLEPPLINLEICSVILTEPDYFYVSEKYSPDIMINCDNSYFTLTNSDIYVAPWGDDSNSGIYENEPLQTIAYAMQIIEPDSHDPKTIHLAEGTYSNSQNNQIFPFAVKSNLKICGAGIESTIFDNEFYSNIMSILCQENIEISNFKIINCQSVWLTGTVNCKYSENVLFDNLLIENCFCSGNSGISISYSENNIIDNVIIRDAVCDDDCAEGIKFHYSDNCIINNVIIDGLGMIGDVGSYTGLFLGYSDLMVRNSIISNCSARDAYLIYYQNIEESTGDNNLDLTNTLIFNNNITYTSWAFAEIYLQHRYQTMNIANCTIANNHGFGNMVSIFGMAELSNNIIYNPDMNNQLFLNNEIYGVPYDVVMSNNLVDEDGFYVDLPGHVTSSGNLWNSEPLFAGECYPYLPENIPGYYQLSAESPCIDAGTADTLGLNIPPMDLAGNERVWNDIIDMGCYEYGAPPHIDNDENTLPAADHIVLSSYPNPVYLNDNRGNVFLEFTLPDIPIDEPMIEIYNIRGQKVKTIELDQSLSSLVRIAGLASRETQRGEAYSTVWNCRNEQRKTVAAGVYFYTLSVSGEILGANKLMILK